MTEVKKKEAGSRDIVDLFKGLTDLARENYKMGLELSISLWEENLRHITSQVNQWLVWQEDYNRLMKDLVDRFPNEVVNFWNGNSRAINGQAERFLALQRDYIDSGRKVSEKLTKDMVSFTQKSVERSFSLFSDYLSLLRG